MTDNRAKVNGGAFNVDGGTVTFERPDKVQATGNYLYGSQVFDRDGQVCISIKFRLFTRK